MNEEIIRALALEMRAYIDERLAALPPVRDGRDGLQGPPGEKGADGKDGRDGIATRDELNAAVKAEVAEVVPPVVKQNVKEEFDVLPILIYKGVWREGNEYAPGNTVTWGGSAWHCNEKTLTKPGNGNTAWTLIVKEGRPGKDKT